MITASGPGRNRWARAERLTRGALPHTLRDMLRRSVQSTAVRVVYPDGPTNAEAFFVDPRSREGNIVTKVEDAEAEAAVVYRVPVSSPRESRTPKP